MFFGFILLILSISAFCQILIWWASNFALIYLPSILLTLIIIALIRKLKNMEQILKKHEQEIEVLKQSKQEDDNT